MFLLGNVPYNKLKLYNCFIFGLKWLQSYISYYFGFKRIFVLGERITCVYSLFAVILFVCKFECNILRVCSAFGCICVDEFVCICVFVTVWSSHAVGIHVWHQLSLTLGISYCKANDVYFCLYLKFILFDNASKRKRNHGTRLGNRTLDL